MNPDYHSHAQFELFPAEEDQQQPRSSKVIFREWRFNLENLIVINILVVILLIVTFSFGVKRGKKLVLLDIPHGQKKSLKIEESAIIEPIVQPEIAAETVAGQGDSTTVVLSMEAPVEKAITIPLEKLLSQSIENSFTIQVASFQAKESAQKEATRLKQKGYETFIMSKGKHSIVCVGKFAQKEEAKAFMPKLKTRYSDCLVRRL